MNQNCPTPLQETLQKILLLQQQQTFSDTAGCDRPFLGPLNTFNYHTRPVQLYNSYTATPWSFSYTLNGTTATTDIFRIEDLEQNFVTLRLLALDATTGEYTNTNQFVTLDLATVGAIRCQPDTFITL